MNLNRLLKNGRRQAFQYNMRMLLLKIVAIQRTKTIDNFCNRMYHKTLDTKTVDIFFE